MGEKVLYPHRQRENRRIKGKKKKKAIVREKGPRTKTSSLSHEDPQKLVKGRKEISFNPAERKTRKGGGYRGERKKKTQFTELIEGKTLHSVSRDNLTVSRKKEKVRTLDDLRKRRRIFEINFQNVFRGGTANRRKDRKRTPPFFRRAMLWKS